MKKLFKSSALVGFAALAVFVASSAHAASTGFNQTDAGPYDYNTAGNWVGSTINGIWNSDLTLTTNQIVTFATDTATTAAGLTFNYAGEFPLTLQANNPGTVNLTLGGNIAMNNTGTNLSNVILGDATNHLNLNLGGATRTITIASNTLTLNDVVSNGAITKTGAGILRLQGTNTFDGVTAINVGTVILRNSSALGSTVGNTTIAATGSTTNGGALYLQNNITSPENITITGGSDTLQFVAPIISSADTNILSGNITLNSASSLRIAADNTSSLTLSGTVARSAGNNGAQLALNAFGSSTIVVNNPINLNGGKILINGTLTTGTGVVQLNSSTVNTNYGVAQIRDTGTLKLGANNVLCTNKDLTIGASGGVPGQDIGTLDLAGYNLTINGLTGASSGSPDTSRLVTNSAASGTSTLTVGLGNSSVSFLGVIADGANAKVALTKVGTGDQKLYGANTYSGPTTIARGSLTLKGGGTAGIGSLSPNTSLTIQGGGTLNVVDPTVGATFYMNFPSVTFSGSSSVQGGTTTAQIQGSTAAAGGLVDFATTPITMNWSGPSSGINLTNASCLRMVSTPLKFNNNQITVVVTNVGGLTTGTNGLVFCGPGISGTVNPTPLYTGGNGVAPGYTGVLSIGSVGPATGIILTVLPSQPNPTNITCSVINGTNLVLNWPAGQGWTLQSQTNSLNTGLQTNASAWSTVSPTPTPPYTNSINPANPSVFYRLKY